MALRNLKELKDSLIKKYQEFNGNDCVLPQSFKDDVKQIGNCNIIYHDYSAVATSTAKPYPKTYIPNQWFYVAYYFVDYIDEVNLYRSAALEAFQKELSEAPSNSDKEALFVRLKTPSAKDDVKERFRGLNKYTDEEIDYLATYVTDYEWWSGGKAICRGDSAVSPVLGMANVVNQNSTFIAEICKFLSIDRTAYFKLKYPDAICVHNKLAPFFIDVFNHLYKHENGMTSIFDNLCPGQPGSVRYAFDKDGMRQTNFFIKGDDNFANARKGDFYEIPFRYNDENYYVSLELAKSRPDAKKEVSFDGLKPIIETLYPNYKLIYDNSTYIFIGPKHNTKMNNHPLQQIRYGTPGTGKSHGIKKEEGKFAKVIRTTFHPDSDYSTFVGVYKPIAVKEPKQVPFGNIMTTLKDQNGNDVMESKITYSFVKQAFLQAYIEAWHRLAKGENVLLVIEEINRGNCAQIFGDLFQLLDRGEDGFSEYPISADADLQGVLAEEFANAEILGYDNVKSGEELLLPKNLYIWATMNTSDQSLFPIDSAFKRRWDWKYMPIHDAGENFKIKVKGHLFDWWEFLDKVNTAIGNATSSEDKKLGYFFCKAENKIISADRFVSKVIFYIWNDVFKDFETGDAKFKYMDKDGNELDLSLLTLKDGDTERKLDFSLFFEPNGDVKEDMVWTLLTENLQMEGEDVTN